jgi:hypothetical protein
MTQPSVSDPGMLYAHGAAVPTDGDAGYATGCVFAHTDGGAATALYVNEGDVDECDFNAVTGTINDIGFEDLDDLTLDDYAAGNIIVADGTGFAEVAVSGDITLAADGAVVVVDAAIADGSKVSFGTSALTRSGDNIVATLPDADPLVAGALWVDGTALKVSEGS